MMLNGRVSTALRASAGGLAIFAAALFITSRSAAHPEARPDLIWSLGYFTPTGSGNLHPADFEWNALTHITYAWALVRADGTLDLRTQEIDRRAPELIAVAHAHGVKVLLGIGQAYWKGDVTSLRTAARDNRPALMANLMTVVNQYGFDGVDLDWEPFRANLDRPLLKELAAALRVALGTRLLTGAAVVTESASWAAAAESFDRIGIMTYDLTGAWNPYIWHNAALYSHDTRVWSIDLAVTRFHDAGIPLEKLSIGIPFFGYQWTGIAVPAPRQALTKTAQPKQIYFRDLAPHIGADHYRWDETAHVPFLSIPGSSTFFTYDNAQSITDKVRYVAEQGLGGWIIWELGADTDSADSPSQPLLHAIAEARRLPLGDESPYQ